MTQTASHTRFLTVPEASTLKEVVAELTLENRLLKKSVTADGEEDA